MLVGKKIGPLVVEKELGAGAMGSVFRAKNETNGRVVAIKLISAALAGNEQAVARFEREVSILKQLDHPNITKYHGTGRYQKYPFFVMEFIEGESLEHVLERRGRLTWEEVVSIGQQLCAALQHAHDKGIIHRDLKPANLMILEDGTVKLTDFGIAKDTDVTALTAANSTLGTASYMAPEQCKGVRDLTPKADLYSMGIMFYELLTGRKPFNADNVMDMFLQHTTATFERPSRWVLEIPIWFDKLICELLEKDPDRRPESAAAVGKALGTIKEKVLTQSSAGLEAAKKRRGDRSTHDIRLDATDKALARELLGKKKKSKAQPFYRQNWFTVAALLGMTALIALGIWFLFIKAPDAEGLYAQAQRLMQAQEWKDRKEAQGPIEDFLRYYPDHAKANEVLRWRDQLEAEIGDYQLKNRRRLGLPAEGDAEKAAFAALKDEEDGKLEDAKQRWQELAKQKTEAAKEQRTWGLVADKYLQELKGVEELNRKLQKMINEEKTFENKRYEGETKEEQLALKALREEESDPAKARLNWEDLKKQAESQPELRRWYLVAASRMRKLQE